jgi:glycosyltransferase involved in cell wall biosynthesis
MRICAVMKYPPIQGGVSARCYWLARSLAERGHQVTVVTNAGEVEDDYRIWIPAEDAGRLEARFPNGGTVSVVNSGRFERTTAYIPYANPYVTKLAALATEEIRRQGAELVFSVYFEPYGLSAYLAAIWTGVPHIVQHAGSDRTRLMDHPELGIAYRELLRHAASIVTGDRDLQGLGIPTGRFAHIRHGFLPAEFTPDGPVCDIGALLDRLRGSPWVSNLAPFNPNIPTFGLYGKLGETKGSFDLLTALSRLRDRGRRFNLLVMAGGRERARFLAAVRDLKLARVTWTLPFLPHWRVPEVLRACTAVCFLERDFPVEIHTPGIPKEIMACGRCAVLSEEVARKQPFWQELQSGKYAMIVSDPRDTIALAATLEHVVADPAGALAAGKAAAFVVQPQAISDLAEAYEAIFTAAVTGAQSPLGREANESVIGELLSVLRQHMPATFRVLDDADVEKLANESNARETERLALGDRALAYADVIAAHFATNPPKGVDNHVLREVIRFERDRLWLAVDTESERGLPSFPRVGPRTATARGRQVRFDSLHPVRSNWLRISEFALDAEAAERALLDCGPFESSTPGAHIFAFQKRGSLKGRIFRISSATTQLIDMCDGTRTVAEIIELAQREHSASAEHIHEKLRRLTGERLLAMR